MNTGKDITQECQNCLLLDFYCTIRKAFKDDIMKRINFMKECNKLDVFARMAKIEGAKVNKVDRHKIMATLLPFHYNLSHLSIPTETLKRVFLEKWDTVYPELSSDPHKSDFYKWAIRIELLTKFCQFSENLGAHMIAARTVTDDYTDLERYTSQLLDYKIADVVEFYKNIENSDLNFFSEIMAYPSLSKQEGDGREILKKSCEYLRDNLNFIGQEYIKFKGLYNSYKHGFRLIFPEDFYVEGEKFIAVVAFLTPKAAREHGGIIDFIGFETEDFSWILEMIDEINYALFCLINNRKERCLVSQGQQKSCSVNLYFPSDLRDLYAGKRDKIEFIL